jgi:hypothetical protein
LIIKEIVTILLSTILVFAALTMTTTTTTTTNVVAQSQQQTRVFIVGSDGTTHEANLKATKDGDDGDGQLRKVSGFEIEAPNVVQINQGKDLVVFTTNLAQDQVQKVKLRNTQGQLSELKPVTGVPNTYSLAGYPVGVYVLDVIVQLSNNNRQGAYETILVIIPANQEPQPINFAVILQTIKTVIDTDIRIIDNGGGDDNDDDNQPTRCPIGQIWNRVQKKCVPIECPKGQHWDASQRKCIPDDCPEGMTGIPPNCKQICPEGADSPECNPCEEDPNSPECTSYCEENPDAPGCQPIDPCIENPDLPECDPCIENPGLPECVEPCPDGRPRNSDGTCPSPSPDPCEEDPNSPECQSPPEPCPEGTTGTPPDCEPIPEPPGPCPEGEDCPSSIPGAGLIPGPEPEPEPEPGNGDNDNGDNGESGGPSAGGSEDDGGDNGDNGGSGGDAGEGESGTSETE